MKAKGWSLRDIARELGVSHETIRTVLAAAAAPELPAHMAPLPKPRRPKSAKKASAAGTLLDVSRELLAELRRRAKATQHPTLRTRYSADATNLAGLVLRLETQEASRVEGLAMSRAEVAEVQAGLKLKIAALIARAQAAGSLACTSCRMPLSAPLDPMPSAPAPRASSAAPTPTPKAAGADGMVAEARAALAWLLTSTADAEAVGDEMSTQRAGRAAVSIAGFVARLERAIAKTRTDQIHVPAAAVDKARAEIEERVSAIRNRPLMCSRCSRAHSVRLGTGLSEAELNAADVSGQ